MAALLAGCVQDDGLFLQGQDTPISISSVEVNDLQSTRADGTPLTTGSFGLYVTGTNLDSKYIGDNEEYKYYENRESYEDGWYLYNSFFRGVLFAGAGKQSAYAYHPYAGRAYEDGFTTNGTTDLLWWKSETTLSEPTFPIAFDHALSKLTINLTKGNEVTSDIVGVTVEGTVLTATPDFATKTWTIAQGTLTAPLSATEITTGSGVDATFSTLLIPQNTTALKITILTSSNQIFVYNHDREHEFAPGTAYTLGLKVSEDRIYIHPLKDITVNSWADGGSLPGDGVAQYDDQAISQTIDARGMSSDALNVAMTAALGVGKKNIEVIMEEEPASGMFSAIKGAISRAENVADGSISLTLSGVKVIPGQYDGYGDYGSLRGLSELAAVNLPDVISIGDRSFENCTNLSTITFPGTVKNIGGYAFHGTKWFSQKEDGLIYIGTILYGYKGELATKNVTIEDGTVAISSHAFANSGITSVEIPASVKCIGEKAFCGESELQTISFAEDSKLETIGQMAFSAMQSLTSIEIPANVTSIGYDAFADTQNLSKISFAEGSKLESIGENAFFACGGSSIEIEIPAGVKSIGDYAFSYTPLTSIEIPAGVKSIGENAFYGCNKLQTISFAEDSKLETIGDEAFSAMQSLTSIEIPANVTSIGSGAFADTPNLRKISFAVGSKLESIVDAAFFGCGGGRENPIEIEIPAGVKSIGKEAFFGAQLTAIEIPAGVTSIGEGAFYYTLLTSIEIPAGVTSIGDQTFMNCGQLQTVTILANQVVSLGEEVFEQSENITSIFVPADLVEDYKATADWRDYALKIKAIEN